MAEFDFTCPFCGESFTCADTMKGMNVSCPRCDERVRLIPDDEVEEEKPEVGLPPPPPVMAKTASQTTEIQVICPHCQQQLLCDLSMRGEYISCPSCGNGVLVQARVVKVSRSGNAPQSHVQMPPPPAIEVVRYGPGYSPRSRSYNPNTGASFSGARKSRIAFILLGIFLGGLGIHNFYAGYNDDGKKQLCLTLILNLAVPFFCILFLGLIFGIAVWSVVWLGNIGIFVWVILDLVRKDCDANGVPMGM